MTNLMKLTSPALLLVLALVAGGCRAADSSADADSGPIANGDDGVGDDEVDDTEWSSPINEALGEAGDGVDDADAKAQQIAVEDLTVTCMADEGFAYHPSPVLTDAERARSDLPPDEFAASYGFGITTMDGASDSDDSVEDPNAAMLAAMPQAEQDAWHMALWGTAPGPPPTGDQDAPAEEPGGCMDEAMAEVYGEDTYDREAAAAFDPLLEEVGSVYDQIGRDPRVVAAREAYSDCMADAGQPGYSVDGDGAPSATEAVLNRLHEAAAASAASGDPDAASSGATLPDGGKPSDLPPDVLAEVREFEIELAVADRACRDAYRRVEREVTFEHETDFVDANRAELEAYRAAVYPEGAG